MEVQLVRLIYIYTVLFLGLIVVSTCLEYKENGEVIMSLTTNSQPIIGQNITFNCLLFNQNDWQASWSKNFDSPLTACTSRYCTADEEVGEKYVFSTNESGIFMSLNFLTNQDVGTWRCTIGRKIYLVYRLKEEDMVYPPSSCVLLQLEKAFKCFSPCVKAHENFTMIWRFQNQKSKAEVLTTEQSVCGHHSASKYNATFQNYTGIIKTNHDGTFTGEGQLICTCGIEGYPTTFIQSSSVEAHFYDCNSGICIAFSLACFVIVIAFISVYIYIYIVKQKTRKVVYSLKKQCRCIILVNGIVFLLISTVIIAVCHVGCLTDMLEVTCFAVSVPLVYSIVCCACFQLRLKKTQALCSKNTETTEDEDKEKEGATEEKKESTFMLESTENKVNVETDKTIPSGQLIPSMIEGDE